MTNEVPVYRRKRGLIIMLEYSCILICSVQCASLTQLIIIISPHCSDLIESFLDTMHKTGILDIHVFILIGVSLLYIQLMQLPMHNIIVAVSSYIVCYNT